MKKLMLIPALTALSLPAFAADVDNNEFSIGLAGGFTRSPYADYKTEYAALPAIHFENKYFYFEGLSGGVKLFTSQDQSQQVRLGVSYLNYEFKPSKTDDARLKRLDKRKDGVMADLTYGFYSQYGNLEAGISQDISGRSKGFLANAQYSYDWEILPSFWLKPAVGVNYASKKFNDYYYGVSEAESLRSGLAAYQAKAGVQPYVELGALYQINKHWDAFASVRVERLASKIYHSPMVDRKYKTEAVVGVTYRF